MVPVTIALATVAALTTLAACSSSSDNSPTPVDLSGSYTVTSFASGELPPAAAPTPQPAPDGSTATLTATDYNILINYPDPNTFTSVGTYTAKSDGTFTQESTIPASIQCTGTWTRTGGTGAGSTLVLDAQCPIAATRTIATLVKN
jgi:hypothetical protein